MRVFFLILVCALSIGGWFAWKHSSSLSNLAPSLPRGEFQTLEITYSAEEIMQARKQELLKNSGYAFLEPKLLFFPFVLMDVKYLTAKGETDEGILLWGLLDGEMVIDTSSWEITHGFEDCLMAKADRNDFKIIEALVKNGGAVDREKFYTFFNVEQEVVDRWIEACKTKKLIATSGNKFRLHFQNPHILQTDPVTVLSKPLVQHAASYSNKIKGKYSISQIKNIAQIAFGKEFAIRRTEEVFLPVYSISVQNPDGSVLTTLYNALNGKKISHHL